MKDAISPRDFAEAIGVSESSVKRWIDQGVLTAARTAGGHRRIQREEALRWLRDTQTPLLRPERLELPEATASVSRATSLDSGAERFHELLVAGAEVDARGLLAGLFIAGHAVSRIADDVIRPALMKIGALWEHGDEGIFIEHRATAICIQSIRELVVLTTPAAPDPASDPRPVAVGGAPSGDPYLVAPALAALALTEAGFQAVNLGPDTPLPVLELAAARLNARLVYLSFGAPPTERHVREVAVFASRLRQSGIHLSLGGRHVDALHPERIPNAFVGRSLGELSAFARGLVGTFQPVRSAEGGAA
jgi:excisionase family DNA binding protein